MTKSNKLPGVLLFTVFVIITLALTLVAGCNDEPEPVSETPIEYSVADLAEMAGESIAYIEAKESADSFYPWFGSGFVVRSDGVIVTNYHVMDGANVALVEVGGQIYENVQVLAANEEWDLAILKIDASNLNVLALADSVDDVRLGEQVVAMGNPEGLKRTVSDGIISTVYRRLEGFNYDHIQTTAPISKGSSGGPLLNMRGEVIGVNTLTYLTGQNLNFAVPIDLLHSLINDLGEAQTVAAIFGSGSVGSSGSASSTGSSGFYEHRPDELAVVISWEGNVDLDLEVWSTDFEYIGKAYEIGDSPDISYGEQGEEWFAFTNFETLDGEATDYSSGKYIVSVYYYGPEPADGQGITDVTLEFYYPSGEKEVVFIEDLWYTPPYDQWFAMIVDADAGSYKLLDLYFDTPLIAMLEWDTEADLDLFIWSEQYDEYFMPSLFWYGYDIVDGKTGLESFRFGTHEIDEQEYDFSKGSYDVLVYMDNPGVPETNATLTLISSELELVRFNYTFTPESEGEYAWLALLDVNLDTLEYVEVIGDERRLFLE
jgi:S1-C subfamily serine protease